MSQLVYEDYDPIDNFPELRDVPIVVVSPAAVEPSKAQTTLVAKNPSDTVVKPDLNEDFLGEVKDAFARMLNFIPRLREASPFEYEAVLTKLLKSEFAADGSAKRGFVRVLLNAVDNTVLNEYLDRFRVNEAKGLTKPSQFRNAVMNLRLKWKNKIDYNRSSGLFLNYEVLEARIIEIATLEQQLHPTKFIKGSDLYPDDELIRTVESILANGKFYSPEWFGVVFYSSSSFDGFLLELAEINRLRLEGKFTAHAPTLFSSQQDMQHVVKVLAIGHERILQSIGYNLYQQSCAAAKELTEARDLVSRHIEENKALNGTVFELRTKLVLAEGACVRLPIVQNESQQLRSEKAKLENEIAFLKEQLLSASTKKEMSALVAPIKGSFFGPSGFKGGKQSQSLQHERQDTADTQHNTRSDSESSMSEDPGHSVIRYNNFLYFRHEAAKDNESGYTALDLKRAEAFLLLKKSIVKIREILKPIVLEALMTNKDFVHSLPDHLSAAKRASQQYFAAHFPPEPNLHQYENQLKKHSQDLTLIEAYIDYDVRDKKIDDGWCHPLILFALAHIQSVNLALYEAHGKGEKAPHRYYPEYRHEGAKVSIELLLINGECYEKVALWHELSPFL